MSKEPNPEELIEAIKSIEEWIKSEEKKQQGLKRGEYGVPSIANIVEIISKIRMLLLSMAKHIAQLEKEVAELKTRSEKK